MARKRKSADFVGVCLKFPVALLDQIDQFAKEEFCLDRADAISEILARGLRPRLTTEDLERMGRQAMREVMRGE